jgi:hypothetical protein
MEDLKWHERSAIFISMISREGGASIAGARPVSCELILLSSACISGVGANSVNDGCQAWVKYPIAVAPLITAIHTSHRVCLGSTSSCFSYGIHLLPLQVSIHA